MRIAMLGVRGLPATYSGFETCVSEVASRLVEKGHQVVVYCRKNNWDYKNWNHNGNRYKGIEIVILPTVRNRSLETIVHTFLSTLHLLLYPTDVAIYFGVGNAIFTFLPRLRGIPTAVNVDGHDWRRKKWNGFAKQWLHSSEKWATRLATAIITDSPVIQRFYLEQYKCFSNYIAYGADVVNVLPGKWLKKFDLEPRDYILYVGRLEPENNVHLLVEAYKKVRTDKKLVIVGDVSYPTTYSKKLKDQSNSRIIFTGFVYGRGYRELCSNSYAYVQPTEVGGIHPALIEAMGFGNCVLVNDTAANLDAIGEAGLSYKGKLGAEDLARQLDRVLGDAQIVKAYRKRAQEYARKRYSWDAVTDEYERLCFELVSEATEAAETDQSRVAVGNKEYAGDKVKTN